MISIALATEDVLSEEIGLRLIGELSGDVTVTPLLRKGGFGYLKSRMDNWRRLAQQQPVFLLTDLDNVDCPSLLREEWIGSKPLPENLVMRIAVREIESWILADHKALRQLIGNKGKLPTEPDKVLDAKECLFALARLADRSIREDLLKIEGAIASQGIGYNARLTTWVRSEWDPERAADRSPSLARARVRLKELLNRLEN